MTRTVRKLYEVLDGETVQVIKSPYPLYAFASVKAGATIKKVEDVDSSQTKIEQNSKQFVISSSCLVIRA